MNPETNRETNSHFFSALGQAAPNLAAIAKGRVAVANIISMIEKSRDSLKTLKPGITFPTVVGEIEFREVCFAYPSRPKLFFEGLSFSIGAGKTFALVGTSGSGKSTIISMVQRFYDPCLGTMAKPSFAFIYNFAKEIKSSCFL